jgi:hypothetical protein
MADREVLLTDITAWARRADPVEVEIVFAACARALLAVGRTRARLLALVNEHTPPAGASER